MHNQRVNSSDLMISGWFERFEGYIDYYQFYIMKVVKSRAFKDRLKGHKESVITLFSPFKETGHMLYSISKDGSVRGKAIFMKVGT